MFWACRAQRDVIMPCGNLVWGKVQTCIQGTEMMPGSRERWVFLARGMGSGGHQSRATDHAKQRGLF